MLRSPEGVVIATADLSAAAEFFAVFGLVPRGSQRHAPAAARALYGVDSDLERRTLGADGASAGTVDLLWPAAAGAGPEPYETGGYAFDLYTREMERSLGLVREAGYVHGPVGRVELGPLVMLQATVRGPDGLRVVLIETERRRPSLLDRQPAALHSEGHSLVWAVPDVQVAAAFWCDLPGLTVPFDMPVAHPEISRFMELPDAEVALRMAMICDSDVSPMRLELLEFVGRPIPPQSPAALGAGIIGSRFEVDDVTEARAVTEAAGAAVGAVVELPDGQRACTGVAPGGVRFELWS